MAFSKKTRPRDGGIWARGVFMGVADVVPGFSGGTVALITGIYERLITSISNVDGTFFGLLKTKQFSKAAEHVDFRFLLSLLVGIACGFIVTLLTVHKLLDDPSTRPFVLAAFLGMVVGSSWFVFRMIKQQNSFRFIHCLLIGTGIAVAAAICLLPARFTEHPPLLFVFVCGAVAICAMILPGISGALILMLLGTYKYFTGIARDLIHRENMVAGLTTSVVFGVGCVVGLLTFSRILRYLFQTRPGQTLSFLVGLMLGSTIRLWPFRNVIETEIKGVVIENDQLFFPQQIGSHELAILAVTILATAVVFAIAWVAGKSHGGEALQNADGSKSR